MSTATELVPARTLGRRARSSTAVVLPMTRAAGPGAASTRAEPGYGSAPCT